MRTKKTVLRLIVLVIVTPFVYGALTAVRFSDYRGHVSGAYCALFGSKQKIINPVIFIPGIKGSELSKDGTNVWLPLRDLLPGGAPLTYAPNDGVVATGVFSRVSVIPGIFQSAPYQRIAAQLACMPAAYFFYYDWRRNPADDLAALGALVDRVVGETGKKPSIIAHSMGGLITEAYLKTHADRIDRVVYVGVPFAPGTAFAHDITDGSVIGLNQTVLSKEATQTHPASFALLPHDDTRIPAEVASFNATLDAPAKFGNKFLFVIGNCQQTEDASGKSVPGDGRVPEAGAYPVEKDFIDQQTVTSCAEHAAQLNDRDVVSAIFKFLTE
jgi:pimeloyl-ACP methyl ester carboxylesterase